MLQERHGTGVVYNETAMLSQTSLMTIPKDTTMMSFDVKSLITNVPVLEGLRMIQTKL